MSHMAHKKRKKHKDGHHDSGGLPPVPIWFLSFGDMITNMLCFYILMVTLAPTQESGFVGAGTGSFIQTGETFGPPGRPSPSPISKDAPAPNYAVPDRHLETSLDGPNTHESLSNQPKDRLRKATIGYERSGRDIALPTPVAFEPGTSELTPESTRHLDSLAELAQQRLAHVTVEAHVSGPDDGWALSALRAAAIARYLHQQGQIAYDRITLAGHGRFRPIAGDAGKPAQTNDRINILLSPGSPH